MFGLLSLNALPHDPITIGGVVGASVGLLVLIAGMTYFRKWGWLWREWFTSLDPKKIGVMYIAVAVIMLLRGLADAAMLRAQQAVFATSPNSPIDRKSVV